MKSEHEQRSEAEQAVTSELQRVLRLFEHSAAECARGPEVRQQAGRHLPGAEAWPDPASIDLTAPLRDHLLVQLSACRVSARERALARRLIEAIGPDGYLRTSVAALNAGVSADGPVDADLLDVVTRLVQSFEPVGVAARSLEECLLLQLDALDDATLSLQLAQRIVTGHLRELASLAPARLADALACTPGDLLAARELIRACNPRPGAAFAECIPGHVVPDVQLLKVDGRWIVRATSQIAGRRRADRDLMSVVRAQRDPGASPPRLQFRQTNGLLRELSQRSRTLLRVAQAIFDRQSRFLDHGDIAMKPLVLREIAEALGMHESTVSRVTSRAYAMTPRGVFELKHFFGSHVDSGGRALSSMAIRALLREFISAEDAGQALSDVRLAQLLAAEGIVVARRTVSKYRDSIGIAPADVRRRRQNAKR